MGRFEGSCMEAKGADSCRMPDKGVITFTVGIFSGRLCVQHARKLGQKLIDYADKEQHGIERS